MRAPCFILAIATLMLTASAPALAQSPKKPLDHDIHDVWKSIRGEAISNDGDWALYSLAPEVQGPRRRVQALFILAWLQFHFLWILAAATAARWSAAGAARREATVAGGACGS